MIYSESMEDFIYNTCELIKIEADKSIRQRGVFTFVLSGGNTPKSIFRELVTNYTKSIEWDKVHLFWLDERCVEPTHEDSNYKLAYDNLISKLDRVGSIHRIQAELEYSFAAEKYEKEITDFFGQDNIVFDLILLGMGEDGHCASIFPNSPEFNEKDKLVVATMEEHNEYHRITLTFPIINTSNKVLLIGSKNKLDVFNNKTKNLPIHMITTENMKVIVKI